MIAIREQAQGTRELPEWLHASDYTKDCRKCNVLFTQPDRFSEPLLRIESDCGDELARLPASAASGWHVHTGHLCSLSPPSAPAKTAARRCAWSQHRTRLDRSQRRWKPVGNPRR